MNNQKKKKTVEEQYPQAYTVLGNIRLFQARQKVSDDDLISTLHVSRATYNRRLRNPWEISLKELTDIANEFGVSPEQLMVEPKFSQPELIVE